MLFIPGANSSILSASDDLPPDAVIFGSSRRMLAVREKLEKVTGTTLPILIGGESGTGKEVLAKFIHTRSPWRDGPFVKVNCPILRRPLPGKKPLSDEEIVLGLQSGASHVVEKALGRGTLFLNEVALLDPSLQVRLLYRLQEGQVLRIEPAGTRQTELRVICATNCQLEQAVEAGNFRRDLYYTIGVVQVHLPPLRERRSDIPQLTNYFLELYNDQFHAQTRPPSPQVLELMNQHEWPGNIRELSNLILRYVLLGSEVAFSLELLGLDPAKLTAGHTPEGSVSLKQVTHRAVQEIERKIILRTLEEHNWNRKHAARALKISYRALLNKIKETGLEHKRADAGKSNVKGRADSSDASGQRPS